MALVHDDVTIARKYFQCIALSLAVDVYGACFLSLRECAGFFLLTIYCCASCGLTLAEIPWFFLPILIVHRTTLERVVGGKNVVVLGGQFPMLIDVVNNSLLLLG